MIETVIADVMTRSPRTIGSERTIEVAARALVDNAIGSLVVTDSDPGQANGPAVSHGPASDTPGENGLAVDLVRGIITESDIVALVAEGQAPTTRVADVMSAPLVTIDATESASTAAERMKHNGVKKLPVTENDRLVGIVTTTDLTHYLPRYQLDIERGN